MKKSWQDRLFDKMEWKENGCREWVGYKDKNGYGQMYRKPKLELTHRLAWEVSNGPIPEGYDICHACDNPSCCYSEHLFLGTAKDNVDDMISKGRNNPKAQGSPGDKNNNAVLREEFIPGIRARLAAGEKPIAISRDFGVSRRTIAYIRSGERWICVK